jgi:hypothetical protein
MTAILPPLVIDVRVQERGKRNVRIWFPFVILWPLLFIVVGFTLVVSMLVDLALLAAGATYHHYTRLILHAMWLLAETRGTHAQVNNDTTHVHFDIY